MIAESKYKKMIVIIGAMKCGTSSLHRYLSLHPEICMSKPKELNFFIEENNWQKGLDWYLSRFDADKSVWGESSMSYTKWPMLSGVPRRMHSCIPGATLVYLMRDPIDRIVSHYIHNVAKGYERRRLNEAIAERNNSHYVYTSRYFMQIQQFMEFYDKSQLMLFELDEIARDPNGVVRKICQKIGVDSQFKHSEIGLLHHVSESKRMPREFTRLIEKLPYGWVLRRVMPKLFGKSLNITVLTDEVRNYLVESLRPDVDQLRDFLGLDLAEWSV
jgi:hypothetical protein